MLPLCEFNATPLPLDGETPDEARERMSRALDALRQYRREWDEKLQRFSDRPVHDWCSDYADALRYLARGRRNAPAQRKTGLVPFTAAWLEYADDERPKIRYT
jgi:hypothetical protein